MQEKWDYSIEFLDDKRHTNKETRDDKQLYTISKNQRRRICHSIQLKRLKREILCIIKIFCYVSHIALIRPKLKLNN